MPMLIVVLTLLLALPATVLGARTVRIWDPINDPDYLRDTVHQGVVAFLRIGLLLLMLCFGAVAVAAGIVAHRDGAALTPGVWASAALTWVMAVSFVVSWRRRRHLRGTVPQSRP